MDYTNYRTAVTKVAVIVTAVIVVAALLGVVEMLGVWSWDVGAGVVENSTVNVTASAEVSSS